MAKSLYVNKSRKTVNHETTDTNEKKKLYVISHRSHSSEDYKHDSKKKRVSLNDFVSMINMSLPCQS